MEAARRAPGTSRKLDETYIQGLLGLRSACFFSFFDSLSIIIIRPISFFLPLAQAWPGETFCVLSFFVVCFLRVCSRHPCMIQALKHDQRSRASHLDLLYCGVDTRPRPGPRTLIFLVDQRQCMIATRLSIRIDYYCISFSLAIRATHTAHSIHVKTFVSCSHAQLTADPCHISSRCIPINSPLSALHT